MSHIHISCLCEQVLARKQGFEVVDQTENGYELLALSWDGTKPQFTESAKQMRIENQELTIFYDDQCPFIAQYIERVKKECETQAIPLTLRHVDSLEKAKALPCVFNNWACFYKGKFETVNLLNPEMLKRILK